MVIIIIDCLFQFQYAIILLSIFIIQVAIGVFAFLQVKDSQDYKGELGKGLRKAFDRYGQNTDSTEAVDATQTFVSIVLSIYSHLNFFRFIVFFRDL